MADTKDLVAWVCVPDIYIDGMSVVFHWRASVFVAEVCL